MPSNCGAAEDSRESPGQQGDQTSQYEKKSILNTYWKGRCWSWSSSILITWCEQSTPWKSPWCLEILRAEREEGIRGWDGWMVSPMQWTWTWANFGRWWGTGRTGVLQSVGSQRVRHNLATEQQYPIIKRTIDKCGWISKAWWWMNKVSYKMLHVA